AHGPGGGPRRGRFRGARGRPRRARHRPRRRAEDPGTEGAGTQGCKEARSGQEARQKGARQEGQGREEMTTNGRVPALELRGVTAAYGRIEVLHGADLVVPAGTVFALLGPNGAGKTTTLKVIDGRLPPTDGCVHGAVED